MLVSVWVGVTNKQTNIFIIELKTDDFWSKLAKMGLTFDCSWNFSR